MKIQQLIYGIRSPNGKKFKFSFILVTCALPTKQIVSSRMNSRGGWRSSRLGPLFFRDTVPALRALHHCLVKKVMYHFRATFKEALKQVLCFPKSSKTYRKMCHTRLLSIVKLESFTKFYSFRMYLMLLNLVHKLKC